MRRRGWLRDPAWLAVVLVSAGAVASVLAMAVSRFAIPAERGVIATEAWPWTADGVTVIPEGGDSPFRSGDRVVAVQGRPLADWASAAIGPPWLFALNPLPASATFTVVREGASVDLAAPLESFPTDRFGGAPPALVIFATTALILALVLVARRPRATALRLLLLGVTCDVATIVAWETGLQPSDLVQRTPFLYAFGLAPVFAVLFWASLLHLLSVYPTRTRWLIARGDPAVVAVYVVPLVALALGAAIAAIPGGGALAWIGRLAPVASAVTSVQIVIVLVAIVAGYRRTPLPRRGQIRLVAGTVFIAAGAELLLVSGPIAIGRLPLASRGVVALLALPAVAALAIAVVRDQLFQVDLLRSSRARIVAAREEERRKLRRDLHDGLGPSLAALGLRVDAVRDDVAGRDPAAAAALDEIRGDVRSILTQVRTLARDLRPPAIDSLGFVGAVRQQLDALTADRGPRVEVDADVPATLPAAIEVAGYRIVVEAVSNVLRHAGARTARVHLWIDHDLLRIEVADDGVGLEGGSTGVGTRAMYERAAEVGGELVVEPGRHGGTVVIASLPIADRAAAPVANREPATPAAGETSSTPATGPGLVQGNQTAELTE